MQAYSMDLRERALLDSDAGMKAADVAVKYRVSGSWVRLLKQRRRETGEVAPRVQRHGRRRMLEPHLHTLAALIAEHTGSHLSRAEGRARHAGQSGDDLARGLRINEDIDQRQVPWRRGYRLATARDCARRLLHGGSLLGGLHLGFVTGRITRPVKSRRFKFQQLLGHPHRRRRFHLTMLISCPADRVHLSLRVV